MSTAERPHVTVATVVRRDDGRFLMVEERVEGEAVLNQPAGHWESGESLVDAAVRETLEETAWQVRIDALLGIYTYHPVGLEYAFLRFAFAATPLCDTGAVLDPAIEAAHWMDLDELRRSQARHRSPMVLRSVEDYLAGARIPMDRLLELPRGR